MKNKLHARNEPKATTEFQATCVYEYTDKMLSLYTLACPLEAISNIIPQFLINKISVRLLL